RLLGVVDDLRLGEPGRRGGLVELGEHADEVGARRGRPVSGRGHGYSWAGVRGSAAGGAGTPQAGRERPGDGATSRPGGRAGQREPSAVWRATGRRVRTRGRRGSATTTHARGGAQTHAQRGAR